MILHAGLVALRGRAGWRGALITGPSGAGKSDLALRLIEQGFSLVADDRVIVWTSGGVVFGRAPDTLAGLIEARGFGIHPQVYRPFARVALVCACTPAGDIERLPEPQAEEIAGIAVPRLALNPFEASAPAKLRRALYTLG